MTSTRLSVTECAVLGLLAEGPRHGFALARDLEPESEVGRVLTVPRPLVYRALDRLVSVGYAEPVGEEKGDGPTRVVHGITAPGRRRLRRWLATPVDHVRDLRIEFLLKLAIIERSGRSPLALIRDQRNALDPTLTALEDEPERDDHVEMWRSHMASAAAGYLEAIEQIHR